MTIPIDDARRTRILQRIAVLESRGEPRASVLAQILSELPELETEDNELWRILVGQLPPE